MPIALIVEDEPEANKLLAMLVQLRGYQTASALTGAQAMEHMQKQVPDVVFLDLMLPDVDGYDICRSLKSAGDTSSIPVIIVTARITEENRLESFRAGADDFIPKPYMPDEIFEALEQRGSGSSRSNRRRCTERPRSITATKAKRFAVWRAAKCHVAWSGLEGKTIDALVLGLKAIWSSAAGWAKRVPGEQAATLSYSVTGDCLTLTFTDESGWLDEQRQLDCLPFAATFRPTAFRRVRGRTGLSQRAICQTIPAQPRGVTGSRR